jgi:hypothetical protein
MGAYRRLYCAALWPDGSVACFNKIGRPQADAKTIVWDGGAV